MTITVLWTPVPAGLRGPAGAPVVSILVSPRLRGDDGQPARLSAFEPFVDWPATVAALLPALRVQFGAGPELPVTPVDAGVLEPALWKAIFPADGTVVRAHEPQDFTKHEILSHSVAVARKGLGGLYGATAAQYASAPPLAQHGDFSRLVEEITGVGSPAHDALTGAMRRAVDFHRPRDAADQGEPWPAPEDLADLLDFHALVSALGDHPVLLRALGLVIDVVLPAQAPRGFAPARLQVRPHFRDSDMSVGVLVMLDDKRFAAVPHEDGRWGGLMPLAGDTYTLVDTDVDGALLKLDGLSAMMGQRASLPAPDSSAQAALPALRSGGLSLVHSGRGVALDSTFRTLAEAEQRLAAGATTLTAEQLIRGYVVDIWDGRRGAWRSLCARYGTYRFTRDAALQRTVHDEGFVQLAVTAHKPDPGGAPILRLHESVARWDGWSLVAPRPGKAMSHAADPQAPPQRPTSDPLTSAAMAIDWKAEPQSLPALRFGRRYRVRARAMDLAGNVVALGEAGDDQALPVGHAHVYRRCEPVAAPIFVLRRALDPTADAGEASDRIVLRTDNTEQSLDAVAGIAGGDRQLVPPRASVLLAETHGMLDDAAGLPRADLYATLSERDGAKLTEDPEAKVEIVAAQELVVPYLPDPFARGVALRDLPGTTGATLLAFTFKDEWPAAVGLRVAVQDGAGPPQWDPDARLLTVALAKAEVARIPVSCFIGKDDLELMAVWEWMREWVQGLRETNPGRLAQLASDLNHATRRALEGGHWMLTPPHELVLVSAVRQPLGHPRFERLQADRELGATATRFAGALAVHGRSTSRVELLAQWTEPVDRDDGQPPELAVAHAALADELILTELPPAGHTVLLRTGDRPAGLYRSDEDTIRFTSEASVRHDFHDTRHRRVRYGARATTRFREYFPPDDPGDFTRTGETIEVSVPASARPAAPQPLYAVPTFGWERLDETGVRVSRRLGGGLRIYLARPWYSSGEDERLAVVYLDGELGALDRRELRHLVTQWGRDPVVAGGRLAAEISMQFPAAAEVAGPLVLPELGGRAVRAATHHVAYDAAHDAYACDVEIRPGAAYRPFVHLALARCQLHALAGVELSPVVMLDFAQLAPDRALIVTRVADVPGRHHVTVSGITYRGTAADPGRAGAVDVVLQEREPSLPDELGWRALPGVTTPGQTGPDTSLLWRGFVDVPTQPGRGPFRVAVHEYERWPGDAPAIDGPANRRTVYLDTMELAP